MKVVYTKNGKQDELISVSDTKTLIKGDYIFSYANIKNITFDLSNLKSGKEMFLQCKGINEINIDLSKLQYGNGMFWGIDVVNPTVRVKSLENLKDATQMFYAVGGMKHLQCGTSLSNLQNAGNMLGATDVQTISFDLSSINNTTSVRVQSMFSGGAFNAENVEKIFRTLPQATWSASYGPTFHIGVNQSGFNKLQEILGQSLYHPEAAERNYYVYGNPEKRYRGYFLLIHLND